MPKSKLAAPPKTARENRESYTDLKAKWTDLFGSPPPKNLSRRLVSHAIAYEEQVRIHGGLSEKTKKRLRELASNEAPSQSTKLPTPGTRLVREWGGRTYIVDVTEEGFKLDRRVFRSLSAVAGAITGSHWSGRAFFGLVKRGNRSAPIEPKTSDGGDR